MVYDITNGKGDFHSHELFLDDTLICDPLKYISYQTVFKCWAVIKCIHNRLYWAHEESSSGKNPVCHNSNKASFNY